MAMKIKLANGQYINNLTNITTFIENNVSTTDFSFKRIDFPMSECGEIFSNNNISLIEIYQDDELIKTIQYGEDDSFIECKELVAEDFYKINVKIGKFKTEENSQNNVVDKTIEDMAFSIENLKNDSKEMLNVLDETTIMLEDLSDATVELGDLTDESLNTNNDLIDAVTELGDLVAEQADIIAQLQEIIEQPTLGGE